MMKIRTRVAKQLQKILQGKDTCCGVYGKVVYDENIHPCKAYPDKDVDENGEGTSVCDYCIFNTISVHFYDPRKKEKGIYNTKIISFLFRVLTSTRWNG